MLSRFLIIVTIFLSTITLALLLGTNIETPLLVDGSAEADASALSSSSGSISNKTVDTLTISASKIKFSIYDNPDAGIKFLYPLGWEPVISRGTDNSSIIEILFPNMTIDNNVGNFSTGHQHGPSTSFIVLSIEEEASYLSDDPNMTGVFQSLNIWTINEDKKYTISYSQPVEEYPTYLGIVQHMIDSFEIIR
jgi:hypothetical protein